MSGFESTILMIYYFKYNKNKKEKKEKNNKIRKDKKSVIMNTDLNKIIEYHDIYN